MVVSVNSKFHVWNLKFFVILFLEPKLDIFYSVLSLDRSIYNNFDFFLSDSPSCPFCLLIFVCHWFIPRQIRTLRYQWRTYVSITAVQKRLCYNQIDYKIKTVLFHFKKTRRECSPWRNVPFERFRLQSSLGVIRIPSKIP